MADCVFGIDKHGNGEITSERGLLLLAGIAALDKHRALVVDPRGFTEVRALELAKALEDMAAWIRTWARE